MRVKRLKFSMRDWALLIASLFVSAWYIMPAVKVLVPSAVIALLGICFLLATCIQNKRGQSNLIWVMLAFFMMFALYYLYTFEGSLAKASGIVTQMIVSLTPAVVFYKVSHNTRIIKTFFILLCIMLAYVLVATTVELLINPGVARVLAHAEEDGTSTDSIRLRNIGGFGHAYGMPFVNLVFFFFLRKADTTKIKLAFGALVLFGIWYIYLSEYFLALLLTLVGLLLTYLSSLRNTGVKWLLIFLCLLALVFSSSIFTLLSSITQGTISEKAGEIAQVLSFGSSQGAAFSARENVYLQSFRSFAASPIWGIQGTSELYAANGGHSTVLDFLGQTGLIGFGSYCLWLWYVFQTIHDDSKEYRLLFLLYIVISVLNPTLSAYEMSAFIFLFVPLLLKYYAMMPQEEKA